MTREPEAVEGEIKVDEGGNVVIGAPAAVVIVEPAEESEASD